ncbi:MULTISPECIES: hypothetical protein [unclassified Crossiella]|uniref:hypothetical protein n=1 Tax=unclassified Crossiella TaxID=2620835 RepID=UPI001FFF4009|nr:MULTISPECIES: hypothetical protein [unclassified Crossiella]MCK2239806.1 hypothetical protein [Crossiella sp. S99.2]MCK2252501.1 hypothetical protein [Crossiella sp. S99.1]
MTDNRIAASADTLARTGRALVDTADAAHRRIRGHSGAQDGDEAANTSFALAQALSQCENTWTRTLTGLATKLAVAGDTLELNAKTYAEAEEAARSAVTPR